MKKIWIIFVSICTFFANSQISQLTPHEIWELEAECGKDSDNQREFFLPFFSTVVQFRWTNNFENHVLGVRFSRRHVIVDAGALFNGAFCSDDQFLPSLKPENFQLSRKACPTDVEDDEICVLQYFKSGNVWNFAKCENGRISGLFLLEVVRGKKFEGNPACLFDDINKADINSNTQVVSRNPSAFYSHGDSQVFRKCPVDSYCTDNPRNQSGDIVRLIISSRYYFLGFSPSKFDDAPDYKLRIVSKNSEPICQFFGTCLVGTSTASTAGSTVGSTDVSTASTSASTAGSTATSEMDDEDVPFEYDDEDYWEVKTQMDFNGNYRNFHIFSLGIGFLLVLG